MSHKTGHCMREPIKITRTVSASTPTAEQWARVKFEPVPPLKNPAITKKQFDKAWRALRTGVFE